MTSRLSAWGVAAGLAALVATSAGCSSDKSGADKFVGTWTYAGAIDPKCMGTTVAPIDLTGYSAVITSTDASHISVALGTLCTVKFDVDSFVATAESGQSCMFDIPSFGSQTVAITKWTLTSTGTDSITSDFNGSAFVCTPAGTGTLTRQGDAGATD